MHDAVSIIYDAWHVALNTPSNHSQKLATNPPPSHPHTPRPLFVRPKKPNNWELANITAQLSFDLLVLLALGPKSLLFLVFGTLLGTWIPGGLHCSSQPLTALICISHIHTQQPLPLPPISISPQAWACTPWRGTSSPSTSSTRSVGLSRPLLAPSSCDVVVAGDVCVSLCLSVSPPPRGCVCGWLWLWHSTDRRSSVCA